MGEDDIDFAAKKETPGQAAPHGAHLPFGVLNRGGGVMIKHGAFKTDHCQAAEGNHLAVDIVAAIGWVEIVIVIVVART